MLVDRRTTERTRKEQQHWAQGIQDAKLCAEEKIETHGLKKLIDCAMLRRECCRFDDLGRRFEMKLISVMIEEYVRCRRLTA